MFGPPSSVPDEPLTLPSSASCASPVDRMAKFEPLVGKKLSESATAFGVPAGGTVTKLAPASVDGSAVMAWARVVAPAGSPDTGTMVAAAAGGADEINAVIE